jgi:hypothetical protein
MCQKSYFQVEKILKVAHVGLYVRNIVKAKDLYSIPMLGNFLEFKVIPSNFR